MPPDTPSLREIAEQAYDDLEAGADEGVRVSENSPLSGAETETAQGPGPEGVEEPLAQDGQPRDKSGRWVSRSGNPPGEAIEPLDPAPKKPVHETQSQTPPDPAAAPQARSNQAPEHWSAEDKATFAKLPQEGQTFLLKRHGEMEAEFTRKSQASAGAVQFTQAVAPVFNDPQIAAVLKQTGQHPVQAISEWANFYKMATSGNQQDQFRFLVDATQRMGLDPARIFSAFQQPSAPLGLSAEDMKDPAVKFFAEHFDRAQRKLNALESQFQQREQAAQQAAEEMRVKHARVGIDSFADEKDRDGRALRPYFNAVLPQILELFRIDPDRDLADAYDRACWADPDIRKQLQAAEAYRYQSQQDLQRARIAQRGNTRGITTPVSRPNGADGPSKGSIRDAIERSAEDIGF